MFDYLTGAYHLHPILDHFTIALLFAGTASEILAAAGLLLPDAGNGRTSKPIQMLRNSSLLLMAGGAAAAVLSYFTGDSEAGRVWDSIPPAARQILSANDGAAQYLSHAALGRYLMYTFVVLAVWRILIELSPRLARWRIAFLITAAIAIVALGYQGKTGGELVYDYGVGMKLPQPGRAQPGSGPAVDSGQHKPDRGAAPVRRGTRAAALLLRGAASDQMHQVLCRRESQVVRKSQAVRKSQMVRKSQAAPPA